MGLLEKRKKEFAAHERKKSRESEKELNRKGKRIGLG
jgi:hypothetical protein